MARAQHQLRLGRSLALLVLGRSPQLSGADLFHDPGDVGVIPSFDDLAVAPAGESHPCELDREFRGSDSERLAGVRTRSTESGCGQIALLNYLLHDDTHVRERPFEG